MARTVCRPTQVVAGGARRHETPVPMLLIWPGSLVNRAPQKPSDASLAPEPPDVGGPLAELVNQPAWPVRPPVGAWGTRFIVRHRGHYEESARELCAGLRSPAGVPRDGPGLRSHVGLWGGTSPMQRRAMRRGAVA